MRVFVAVLLWLSSAAWATGGYYRYPALHGDTLVFTAEGDLWKVNVAGGDAQRLTTHQGIETHAAISPDGQWIAFSAGYEGPTEAYVMPIAGGTPRRLTWYGSRVEVAGWSPRGFQCPDA
jgi:tricorn protease